MKQIEFKLPTWGGKRKNAGRKPNGDKPGVSHLRRPSFAPRHPVHVTLRLLAGVVGWGLDNDCGQWLADELAARARSAGRARSVATD